SLTIVRVGSHRPRGERRPTLPSRATLWSAHLLHITSLEGQTGERRPGHEHPLLPQGRRVTCTRAGRAGRRAADPQRFRITWCMETTTLPSESRAKAVGSTEGSIRAN